MAKQRVLIAVKTYPTLSEKYLELSCTAGFHEDGSWIRLYPVPFRLLEQDKRFEKYQWIEADIAKNRGDPRPESFKIINTPEIKLLNKISTGKRKDWIERKRLIFNKNAIYTSLDEIIRLAHSDKISLAIFKPSSIEDFVVEKAAANWPADKLEKVLVNLKQTSLFKEGQDLAEFKIMPKVPYKFSYRFKDALGKASTLMIEDWEIGQLYLNCVKKGSERDTIAKVREKYFDDFVKTKDLYLFLGTTYEWHVRKAKNPFVIIGTFHPPIDKQGSLGF
jgi:hypothetical protein